ncbi:ISL3 family transposase [Chamaesiphon minutus]|uniref:Transposase family protein n=1 Tax=Chamaesiphon minutus (strain ATCC 27169 / PCC 6605) TaxID=1173020 RepID=K9UDJ7_CHAP6|nr:ISL3 family transposase [Chamaesiphon minutus]AFY92732.1 transposase family protein [Chamaesiphon minutus PCC 6605]AFY92880.1 transposase family protein [Chamaesiphon minutus PCC 6605]AFY93192.1 transposase family protein [Chamaesiphon minutus PCC 6605]
MTQFLKCLLPGFQLLRLEHEEIDTDEYHITANVSSTQASVQCPVCANPTTRIHSRYERTLADLPCVNYSLTLVMQVCKFFCDNTDCIRRIFTERIPEVTAPWARKTSRLSQKIQTIGLALGGAAGASLCGHIGIVACGSTLLNHLKKLSLPAVKIPRIMGVDDFAFRKGERYGTILVDLELNQPIALLADRKAETLTNWLIEHPGVEILSRDRSKTYKSAMDKGAPAAIQVADRFHLVQNLEETLEKVFSSYSNELKAIEQQQRQTFVPNETVVVVTARPTTTAKLQVQKLTNYQQRVQQQQKIKRLSEQQWSQIAIAQAVGVSVRTVQRHLAAPDLPEIAATNDRSGRSLLEPYKQSLLEWWNAEIRQPKVLMVLLKQQGYTGSERTLTRYLGSVRAAQGLPPSRVKPTLGLPIAIDPQLEPLTKSRAAFLILKRVEHRDAEDTKLIARIVSQHPTLALAVELADEFLRLLREQRADAFDDWLLKAVKSSLKPIVQFAEGLFEDYAAVKASMMTTVSNGPVEGLNNRLKMLKRQMYGRAGLDLLTKRFLLNL